MLLCAGCSNEEGEGGVSQMEKNRSWIRVRNYSGARFNVVTVKCTQ